MRFTSHEYATLYDTANRIPVYSAYKFEGIKVIQSARLGILNLSLKSSAQKWQLKAASSRYKIRLLIKTMKIQPMKKDTWLQSTTPHHRAALMPPSSSPALLHKRALLTKISGGRQR
ncbi:hypothetical protein MHYP_G00093450 [Metynnis hypsauchen]